MEQINQAYLTGERALFQKKHATIINSTFANGESPLKESSDIKIRNSIFKWKYPLWYSNTVDVEDTTLLETARSGIWYTHHIQMKNCSIEAPKTFRRSSDITLNHVTMPIAEETLWNCQDITLNHVQAKGNYFGMNSSNIEIDHFSLSGNYAFDGAHHIHVKNAKLLSKDAFWNCEHVIVEDSFIIGEYLGWNSKDVTFVNCTIDSLQGLCYIEDLKLINCKLLNTTQAFEYSTVEADVTTVIDSVMNPYRANIQAKDVTEVILDAEDIDPSLTIIHKKELNEYAV